MTKKNPTEKVVKDKSPMETELRIDTAWVITTPAEQIGSGQRGQNYIFWDEADAKDWIDERKATLKSLSIVWHVTPCEIHYLVPKKK